MELIHSKGAFDCLRITGEQNLRTFLQDVGDHEQGQVIMTVFADLIQGFDERVPVFQERFGINGGDLRNRQGMGSQVEFLQIVADQVIRRHIRGSAPGEDRLAKLFTVDSRMAGKAFRQHIAVEMAKRALTRAVELAGGEMA